MNVVRQLSALPLVLTLVACSGAATWTHEAAAEIGPDTTEFTAWVTERDCASGQSSAGRIIGPDIDVSSDSIVVTFRVRSPSGFGGQTCQGNPPTPVTVRLPQPLGDRTLLDGGREPPQEPPTCAIPESCE